MAEERLLRAKKLAKLCGLKDLTYTPPTTVPALLERLALSQYAEAVAANGWTELQTLLELSEAPAEPPTTPPTSKLFEQAKALMKVGHARRLADMTAQLAAAVRARKQ